MTRTVFILVIAAAASGLLANDIAISDLGASRGWLLLEDPYGSTGPTLNEFAGDPGMPAPDALNWPHAGAADGTYPQTDLWMFARGEYTRATNVLGADKRATFPRTLYAVFTLAGQPHVLHYDPYATLKQGFSQVLRVDEATALAGGTPPAGSIVFASAEFIDAPAASPDGEHIVFRAFKYVDKRFVITLRVYSTRDWKLVAESEPHTFGRPVWIDGKSLAVVAFDAAELPAAPQRDPNFKFSVRTLESHTPQAGKLLRLDLAEGKLAATELLTGEFPPDRYTRTVLHCTSGLVVARKDGTGVVVELREPKAGGAVRELSRFETYRGSAISDRAIDEVRSSGIRTIERAKTFVVTVSPLKEGKESKDWPWPEVSPEGHGGLIDLGWGTFGVLEAVANPEYEPPETGQPDKAQLLRHTISVPSWRGCDTMRNPRVLQQLSKLVRRFAELGTVKTTLLAFDVELAANNGRNKKSGRYIELYSAGARKGRGAIRMEDNLSGQWLVQSIDGGGERATDDYYSWSGVAPIAPPKMDNKPAANAGKAYDDLITQLEARRLLMLSGVENDWSTGGLTFLKRETYRDPSSGATWRTWVYEKFGSVMDEAKYKAAEAEIEVLRGSLAKLEGEVLQRAEFELVSKVRGLKKLRERIEIRFVADLPMGSRGDWRFPHAIAQVQMRFALSNQQQAAYTELSFEPDRWVALPNLVTLANEKKPGLELLLPKVFRIYGRNNAGQLIEELKATAVDKEFTHKAELVNGGKLTPGYEVPKAALGNTQFVNLKR